MPELIFSIDKAASERAGALAIAIKPELPSASLRKLANGRELEALAFLIKASQSPDKGAPFTMARVPYSQSVAALKLLAATGKLYYNGKQVACDLFGSVPFHFQAESAPDGTIAVTGRLKLRDKEIDVRECDFICGGTPHWFIKGIFLQMMGSEVSWSDLKRCYYQAPLTREFLDEIDGDDPKVVYLGNAEHAVEQGKDPLPVLKLVDKSGAFADLWMDYGSKGTLPYHDPVAGIQRRKEAETNWEKDLLETDFVKKLMPNSHYYCPLDKVAKSLTFLLELGWQILDWKGNSVIRQGEANLEVHGKDSTIVIKGTLAYGMHKADIKDVAGAFNRRERFVQLGTNQVGLLPHRWEETSLGSLHEGEVTSEGIQIKKSQIGAIDDLIDTAAYADPVLKNLGERIKSLQKIEPRAPGKGFRGELRQYQQEGVGWLSFLYDYALHGILADDMGLGKTVQVLAFLSLLTIDAPILIVVPTSLIFNWKREIERFLPEVPITIHHGPTRANELTTAGIVLTSYATLRLDQTMMSKISYQCVILDEAQAIKNPDTQTARAVCGLESRFRLSITGTPIENHLGELWSQFRFLIPDLLGTEQEFAREVQAASLDSRYLQRIRKKICPFVLRRKKEEVAKDLPEKIEQAVWVEMEPPQRRQYDDFLASVKGGLMKKVTVDGMGKHRMEVLEAILRLRQLCCHPLLVGGAEQTSSSKMERLLEDMETALEEGRKVLVYSQFTTMLTLIGKEAKSRGWNYAYLDGTTEDREKEVKKFQEDPEVPFFLISLKAGGIGLNLTAADYVFLYDPWWNDAVERQAIDRAHRIGRKDTVIAKRYIMAGTIEEKMMKLKEMKRALADDLIDEGGSGAALSLTQEDFLFLVQ